MFRNIVKNVRSILKVEIQTFRVRESVELQYFFQVKEICNKLSKICEIWEGIVMSVSFTRLTKTELFFFDRTP